MAVHQSFGNIMKIKVLGEVKVAFKYIYPICLILDNSP